MEMGNPTGTDGLYLYTRDADASKEPNWPGRLPAKLA